MECMVLVGAMQMELELDFLCKTIYFLRGVIEMRRIAFLERVDCNGNRKIEALGRNDRMKRNGMQFTFET